MFKNEKQYFILLPEKGHLNDCLLQYQENKDCRQNSHFLGICFGAQCMKHAWHPKMQFDSVNLALFKMSTHDKGRPYQEFYESFFHVTDVFFSSI